MSIDLDEESQTILMVLALARSPAPLGYISLHTNIAEPLETLERLEGIGLVRRSVSSNWSCCLGPLFEVPSSIRTELSAYLSVFGDTTDRKVLSPTIIGGEA